jgi:hypothetical protein
MMPLQKVFVKRFVVLFYDYYISIRMTGGSAIAEISASDARLSLRVRDQPRKAKRRVHLAR